MSTTGNDSNPGTFAAPWLTIQHAANTVTAGATVNVLGGVYNGYVSFPKSGTASEPITFQSYPVVVESIVQPAVIDGTGLTVSGTQGLITISGARNYITVKGFEIRNLSSSKGVPCGVWITGSGTGVQILNNQIHNIVTTSENSGNGCGLFAYGTSQIPITKLVVSGNELYDLKTGNSETMTLNGNVTNFQVINNLIHDNDNIGIDIIGYEKTGPTGYDQAGWGVVSGNTIYNISGIGSAAEGNSYDADGLYCDGCAYTTFERNVIMQVDYGIETTSEKQRCLASGNDWPTGVIGVGTPATGTYPCYGMYATVRNNLFYNTNACGNSIGGYALATSKANSNGGGSSFHDVFVNNTLYNNGIQPGNDSEGTPSGEFQIQNQVGSAQDNYFENNAVYAGWPNIWINSYVPFTQTYPQSLTYPPPPATLNWNLYNSAAGYLQGTSIVWGGLSPYVNFSNWQASSEEDANSLNADPQFVNMGNTPPNLDTFPSSPAVAAGSTSLSCSVGWCDPNGSSPTSIYGNTDFLGNPRTNGSKIDIGAYQNTGDLLDNSLTVDLSSAESTLIEGQSTTLTVTVTAIPGGGGAPSGTVSIMSRGTLLETATLMPTGVNTTAATLPLSASQLAQGNNTLTAVYSGNSIKPCCTPSEPPGGTQTPVPWYPSATSPGSRTIVVSKAALTVTANNATMNVGAALPAFTASYTGFVNGDTAAVLSGAPSLTTTATSSSPAGTYPITAAVGTLSAANYSFASFVSGTLTIVTVTGPKVVLTTTATLSGSATAGYTASVTVRNTGTGPAANVTLTSATLGSAAGSVIPQSLGTLAANGGSATVTVNFPASAGANGAGTVEKYAGTYTGGTFAGNIRAVLP